MSAPSTKPTLWYGIARGTIPWFPTINHDKCIGCGWSVEVTLPTSASEQEQQKP